MPHTRVTECNGDCSSTELDHAVNHRADRSASKGFFPTQVRSRYLSVRTSYKKTSGEFGLPTSTERAFYGQVAVLGSRNTEKDLHLPTSQD